MDMSRHEARLLVERIRREHTLDGSIIGTRFESLLSNCLDILSSQLYAKSTHFLLELIQNADDNAYDCTTPTLRFTYKPGALRIDCNEVGFTAENVEAICAISQSTKSSKTQHGEFIGEKGIGFKSVFKAADVVWIASREFTFKFDRTKPLGMVTPIWADFPETTLSGFTSMYLQLSEDYEEETIVDELLAFDVNWLMFLRRIEEISVRVSRSEEAVWEKTMRKTEAYQGDDKVVSLHVGESNFQYLIRTHVIKDLPKERKRPDWTQTTVLLAFPIAAFPRQPRLKPENVYAFLPIRNYGLKFLLQGDFLLTANREDIESTLSWNCAIRDASVDAFLLSINHFNKGQMKYIWPFYLPSTSTAACTFFEPAVVSILADLADRYVLESCAGTMAKPSSLKYVPGRFLDEEGIPFTKGPLTAASYLSSKYPEWAIETIDSIGVSHMSPRDFLEHLGSIMTQAPTDFRARPAEWHSQLAETLLKLTTEPDLMDFIQDLCLIPLHDGSWTAARGQVVFFSRSETSLDLPSGIKVLAVDSTTESDTNRRKLFTILGVKDWEASEICRLVLKVHQSSGFDPNTLTRNQLISHAAFLYKASWQPPKTSDLWFATMQGKRCLGKELYIPGNLEKNSTAARIFKQLQKQFPVIDDGYLDAFPSDPDWSNWLIHNLGLSMVPRLVNPSLDPDPQPTKILELHGDSEEQTRADRDIQKQQEQQTDRESPVQNQIKHNENHALQDYQMQLMLLERQKRKRKRLMMARNEDQADRRMNSNPQMTETQHWFNPPSSWMNHLPHQDKFRGAEVDTRFSNDGSAEMPSAHHPPAASFSRPAESAPDDSSSIIFSLSQEFTFLFREADTSDVLQLLRDNWQHYSQWIDGAHMHWQKPEFRASSSQLKSSLGACQVQSARGIWPLQETVAPMLDPALDEGCLIPAVKIRDPFDADWALLSHFGVIVKLDIHYYLRCLVAVSRQPGSDVNKVAYIYEQIQIRYKGNEELISAAFHENDIVLIHKRPKEPSTTHIWTSMRECVSSSVAVEDQYRSCSYLFRCLASPSQDPIALVVATATFITSSSKLDDITRFFYNVSAVLKDINPTQIAQVLAPLQNIAIFPILDSSRERGFDRLLSVKDTSWFIADSTAIRTSFLGNLPLLALPLEELPALDDLFRVLWLGGRMLSKIVSVQAYPKGRVTTDWDYTISMRKKSPFIKALVPHSHHDRTTIIRQMEELRISIATEVSQTFSLNLNGMRIEGHSVQGQVSLSRNHNLFHLIMTEECANAKCPPYTLVSLIADACAIQDPIHYSLLCTVLGNSNLEDINSAFSQRGLHVKGLAFDKLKKTISRGDVLRIPFPSSARFNSQGSSFRGMPGVTNFTAGYGGRYACGNHRDRRLPIMRLIRADGSVDEGDPLGRLVYELDHIEGWDHTQHLGEHMFSKLLKAHLGQAYDPEKHWTSDLRARSGYTHFCVTSATSAAFTITDPEASVSITRFITEHGQSQTLDWKDKLRATSAAYHLDLVASGRGKTSNFVISSSQVERIRNFRVCNSSMERQTDVAVLVQVNDVYSGNELSFDIYVDPWYLFDSNTLTLKEGWLFEGTIRESHPESGRKRVRTERPSIPWAIPMDSGLCLKEGMTLRGPRKRGDYSYGPLRSGNIRLLYLLPGGKGDQLHGVIIQAPYRKTGTYRAVSYVWGTGRRNQQMITPDGILRITASLASCLRRLRHKSKPAMLWVDAISINQNDNKEKAQQVRMLAKIFQSAAEVYGFSGHSKASDTAVEMLMQVRAKAICEEISTRPTAPASDPKPETSESGFQLVESTDIDDDSSLEDWTDSEQWPEDLREVPASWIHRPIPQLNDAIWTAVGSFFAGPWFRRAWIIQETVAAHRIKLVCGRWIIDWDDLYQAMEIVDREVQISELDFSQLRSNWEPFMCLAAQREWEARNSRWSLLILLENYRHAKSTLSRDRLFALLGLASDGNDPEFEPDYASPLEDVVLRFARVFIRQGRGIYLLYRAGLTSNRFPSWIPDWTVERPSSLSDSSDGGMPFSASGPQQSKMKCIQDSDELVVEGYTVDVIERISESSNLEKEWRDYFREIDEMVDCLGTSPIPSSTAELKWKVPIAGAEYAKVAVSSDLDMKSSYIALRKFLVDGQGNFAGSMKACASGDVLGTEQADANLLEKQSSIYRAALQDRVSGWRFIITERGYTGVVPRAAQKGDTVAIMKGGCVPFILQKAPERPGAFRLAGECYVHGIMKGEGLLLPGVLEIEFCIF